MKTFKESLQNHQNLISTSANAQMCRYYNNFWGAYTNTNMSIPTGNECLAHITGHIVGDCQWFCDFLKSTLAPGAAMTVLPESWESVMIRMNLITIVCKDIRGIPEACVLPLDDVHPVPGIYCEC